MRVRIRDISMDVQVANFGNPFLLQIGDTEPLGHVKQRIQVRSALCRFTAYRAEGGDWD